MKLAEALLLRSDFQKKIAQLTSRLQPIMLVKSSQEPQEDPSKLLAQLRKTIIDLEEIIIRINKTNIHTKMPDDRTLMEGLAERDSLKTLVEQLRVLRQSAQVNIHSSYDLKNTIKLKDIQSELDQTGRKFRELDTEIQGLNWTIELME